jgi:hypothetical protein
MVTPLTPRPVCSTKQTELTFFNIFYAYPYLPRTRTKDNYFFSPATTTTVTVRTSIRSTRAVVATGAYGHPGPIPTCTDRWAKHAGASRGGTRRDTMMPGYCCPLSVMYGTLGNTEFREADSP